MIEKDLNGNVWKKGERYSTGDGAMTWEKLFLAFHLEIDATYFKKNEHLLHLHVDNSRSTNTVKSSKERS